MKLRSMHIKSQIFKGAVAAVVLAASQACLASVVTLTLLPGSAANVSGNAGTSAPGFGSGSWAAAAPGPGTKSEVYILPSLLFSSPLTIGEISSISYWTNKGGASTAVDWYLTLYTAKPLTGNSGSWYNSRLTTEPYFTQTGSVTANTWHQWSTGTSADSLRFFDSPRSGHYGSYDDPLLADLRTGPVSYLNTTTNTMVSHDYSAESILYFTLGTGSAWANGFAGLVDGLTVTRTNGDVGIVNFENTAGTTPTVPEPGSLALLGLGLAGLVAARRRKAA